MQSKHLYDVSVHRDGLTIVILTSELQPRASNFLKSDLADIVRDGDEELLGAVVVQGHVVQDEQYEGRHDDGDDVAADDAALEVAQVRQGQVEEEGGQQEEDAEPAADGVDEAQMVAQPL